jgi:hypothetical protein
MAELSGQGPVGLPQATTVATTDALIALGTRARDAAGNEYVYVSFGETLTAGGWVQVRNGVATRMSATSRGPVGIVITSVTSIDNGWVQIYGVYDTAQVQSDGSDATSAYVLGGVADTSEPHALASSVSTLTTNLVHGAFILAAASTATTLSSSAHSGCTVQVQLNYPFTLGYSPSESTAVSS